jgi:hypothetical protein
MLHKDHDPCLSDPNYLDDTLRKELEQFELFMGVTATATVRSTKYDPGKTDQCRPSLVTIYEPVPVAAKDNALPTEPALGLVLSMYEYPTQDRLFESKFHGKDYFDDNSDRIVIPCLTVISTVVRKRARMLEQLKRPGVSIETDLDGNPERKVFDPSFVMGSRLEVEYDQQRFGHWLGMLTGRIS